MNTITSENFAEVVLQNAEYFEDSLLAFLKESNPIPHLHDGLIYSLGLDSLDRRLRGKRIRPVLALLSCEALGGLRDDALSFAISIELMHNFALIHDDIEDGDEMRRNRPAVWKKYGLAHGINIGDYFFCKVYTALLEENSGNLNLETRFRLLKLMTETLDHTHRGQAMDINARGRDEFSVDEYLQIVTEKTGYYLAAPLMGGAIVCGATQPTLHSLGLFGRHLGPLFQIKDDLIDLTSGKGRGENGADIREGKRSYLVAWSLSNGSDSQKEKLVNILNRSRETTSDEDVASAAEIFEACGAIQQAENYCEQLHSQCINAVEGCPEQLKNLLVLITDYLANRKI